jgi:hypothetical protein
MVQVSWKKAVLWSWLILATIYSLWNIWQNVLGAAYVAGGNNAIISVIQQASDKKCQPINLYAGDAKVDLINVACLKEAPSDAKKEDSKK